ncbi:DUF2493 domain-containing protein [Zongyangia hominis]|uniref:DUF2493 domain-containing protein n=1 Tax=Zongyangia hominis TaxID=2763677 RepID=A0A926IAI7_9FIRM|nr:DUF2493 domain-containing protein [Zongyangia hominis]MBC8569238.1 hypothetical protein [Zongyangia hominis]
MKVAIVGSRSLNTLGIEEILPYVPQGASEIISGGAKGVDTLGQKLAQELGLKFTCFAPDYERYGKRAPIVRNEQIVDYADYVLAFWDAKSPGTRSTILCCIKKHRLFRVVPI